MSRKDEIADDLEEIKEKIEELLFDARELVDEACDEVSSGVAARAHLYWIAHIDQALTREDWFSLQSTINELRKEDED